MAFHPPITDTERISRLAARVSNLESRLKVVERESTDILGTAIECFQKDESIIDAQAESNKFKDTKIAQQAVEIADLQRKVTTLYQENTELRTTMIQRNAEITSLKHAVAQADAAYKKLQLHLAAVKRWGVLQKERADAHKARYYKAVYGVFNGDR